MYIQSIKFKGKNYIGFELIEYHNLRGRISGYGITLVNRDFSGVEYYYTTDGMNVKTSMLDMFEIDGKRYSIPILYKSLNKNKSKIYNLIYYEEDSEDYDIIRYKIIVCIPRGIDLELRKILKFEVVTRDDYIMDRMHHKVVSEAISLCDTFILSKYDAYVSLFDYLQNESTTINLLDGEQSYVRISVMDMKKYKELNKQHQTYQAKRQFITDDMQFWYGKYCNDMETGW